MTARPITHPSWCDTDACQVDAEGRGWHRSRTAIVGRDARNIFAARVALWMPADPRGAAASAATFVELLVPATGCDAHTMTAAQAVELGGVLLSLGRAGVAA